MTRDEKIVAEIMETSLRVRCGDCQHLTMRRDPTCRLTERRLQRKAFWRETPEWCPEPFVEGP